MVWFGFFFYRVENPIDIRHLNLTVNRSCSTNKWSTESDGKICVATCVCDKGDTDPSLGENPQIFSE